MASSRKAHSKKRALKLPRTTCRVLKKFQLKLRPNGHLYLKESWEQPNAAVLFGEIGMLGDRPMVTIFPKSPTKPCPLKTYPFRQKYHSTEVVRAEPPLYDYYLQHGPVLSNHLCMAPWMDMGASAAALWNALCRAGVTVIWAPHAQFDSYFARLLELAARYPYVAMSPMLVKELDTVPEWTHGQYHKVDSKPLHRHLDAFFQQLQALDLLRTCLPQPAVQARLFLGASSGCQDASTLRQLQISALPLGQVCQLAAALRRLVPNLPPPQ